MALQKPNQITVPFASSGVKNTIPETATGSNLASMQEGFPTVTMTDVDQGGMPPQGQDMNGILFDVTKAIQYQQAGGLFPYDATFASKIDGYPIGALLTSADGTKIFQNMIDGNRSDPENGGQNWNEILTSTAIAGKQDKLTPAQMDAVNSGITSARVAIYDSYAAGKQDTLTFDNTPTEGSLNPVTSDGIATSLSLKQDNITVDAVPTSDSTNPVQSGGVYDALATKADQTDLTAEVTARQNADTALQNNINLKEDKLTFDNEPTESSENSVKSGGIWSWVKGLLSGFLEKTGGQVTGRLILGNGIRGIAVQSGADMDDLVPDASGGVNFWYCNSLTTAGTVKNLPASGLFNLTAECPNVNLVRQTVSFPLTGERYSRTRSQGAWSAWLPENIFINVKDFGAKGDGTTNDTTAIVAAATACGANDVLYFPQGNYNMQLSPSNADAVLNCLNRIKTDSPLTISLAEGVFSRTSPITLNPASGGGKIQLKGVAPVSTTIKAGTPTVVPVQVSGNRYRYSVTLSVADASNFNVGDYVVVETTGVNLSSSSYNETVNGARHRELDGFWYVEAVNKTGNTITVRNFSRASRPTFPGAGTVAAAKANVTGGTITKYDTILEFDGCSGLDVVGDWGGVERVAIIGENTSSAHSGIDIDSTNQLSDNSIRSCGAYNIGIYGFGYAINCDGANASFSGDRIFGSNCIGNCYRFSNCQASITRSMASGCGGNGFFATNSASVYCSNSLGNGNYHTAFIANRASLMTAEYCTAIGNGNTQDDLDVIASGGTPDNEGKGFESEAGSKMMCDNSVAIFNNAIGFYALAASEMCAQRCVSSSNNRMHGFYALAGSSIYCRNSVAQRNAGRGFYSYGVSRIAAQDTVALSNSTTDYVAQGGSTIFAMGMNASSTCVPSVNTNGLNTIVTQVG